MLCIVYNKHTNLAASGVVGLEVDPPNHDQELFLATGAELLPERDVGLDPIVPGCLATSTGELWSSPPGVGG